MDEHISTYETEALCDIVEENAFHDECMKGLANMERIIAIFDMYDGCIAGTTPMNTASMDSNKEFINMFQTCTGRTYMSESMFSEPSMYTAVFEDSKKGFASKAVDGIKKFLSNFKNGVVKFFKKRISTKNNFTIRITDIEKKFANASISLDKLKNTQMTDGISVENIEKFGKFYSKYVEIGVKDFTSLLKGSAKCNSKDLYEKLEKEYGYSASLKFTQSEAGKRSEYLSNGSLFSMGFTGLESVKKATTPMRNSIGILDKLDTALDDIMKNTDELIKSFENQKDNKNKDAVEWQIKAARLACKHYVTVMANEINNYMGLMNTGFATLNKVAKCIVKSKA